MKRYYNGLVVEKNKIHKLLRFGCIVMFLLCVVFTALNILALMASAMVI